MIREEYFRNLEARYVKYWYEAQEDAPKVIELAREIAKYTDDEKKVTRIVNALRKNNVSSIENLMKADIDELAKIRNIGLDAVNILRQIKCLPTITYADVHPFSKKIPGVRRKLEITEELHKLGYEYRTELYDDGTIMTHYFILQDAMYDDCYWKVAIENHTEDDDKDYLIYVSYHDPDQKDWDGHQIDISGCVGFEAMKLIVEFTGILKKGEN